MRARSFSHVGITVRDFNEFVRFYWDVFGCELVGVSDSPTDRVKGFFGVDAPAPTCKIGWLRVPGGVVLEIFEFTPQQPFAEGPWNRVGQTHFSLNIRNVHAWHAYLKGKGVTIVSEPSQSPNGGQWFFFIRDCDGNLIELMDLGKMYHILKWLGPFGAWLSRKGWLLPERLVYTKYYEPTPVDRRAGTGTTGSTPGNTQ